MSTSSGCPVWSRGRSTSTPRSRMGRGKRRRCRAGHTLGGRTVPGVGMGGGVSRGREGFGDLGCGVTRQVPRLLPHLIQAQGLMHPESDKTIKLLFNKVEAGNLPVSSPGKHTMLC